jgi:hypothetical protein
VICAILGAFFTRLWYVHKIDGMTLAHAQALEQARAENIKGLEDATNSLLLADQRYQRIVADRSALLDRLRRSTADKPSQDGDSLGACQARATALGAMVRDLSDMAEKCDSGWHECAKRKDALIEVIK